MLIYHGIWNRIDLDGKDGIMTANERFGDNERNIMEHMIKK